MVCCLLCTIAPEQTLPEEPERHRKCILLQENAGGGDWHTGIAVCSRHCLPQCTFLACFACSRDMPMCTCKRRKRTVFVGMGLSAPSQILTLLQHAAAFYSMCTQHAESFYN